MVKKKKPNKKIKLVDITKIRFAPEIEVEFSKKDEGEKMIERGRSLKGWELKADYSLEQGCELSPTNNNKLYWNEESLMQIKEVLALIRVHRGKIVPERCGLHIHVNVSELKDSEILTVIKEWVHRQKFIVKKFNVHKHRLEQTCRLLPIENLTKLTVKEIHDFRNQKGYSFMNYDYLTDKYYSLNASHLPKLDYQTLEFRLFSGTLKFKEIKEAILFVLTFLQDSLERE